MRFSVAFTAPSFPGVLIGCVGMLLARRHSTVSRVPQSLWTFGRILATQIWACVPGHKPVVAAMGDTTVQHKGKRVFGKGCHHDVVRSAHARIVPVWSTCVWCWPCRCA